MSQEQRIVGLRAGEMNGVARDGAGKFHSSRAEMGREAALEILTSPVYRENLKKRMELGEGGAIEVWLWRIGYGDPPKPKEDSGEDEARWARTRDQLRAFMKENPEAARLMAEMIAKQPGKLPKLLEPPPGADSTPGA
ncbi:MAG TPA: hypothetical protein VI589_06985 [Vicinamibacteria bacterium]